MGHLTSGYGVQSKYIVPRFQALGHDMAIFAWFGLQGGKLNMGGVPVYPMGRDPYGNDIVASHVRDFRADLLITLIDIWVLDPNIHANTGAIWAPYFPIDHAPVSNLILDRARLADYPIQYSQFGLAETERAGLPCHYVPHGVSPEYEPGDKHAARKRLGLPQEAFLCAMVAANKGFPDRKGFQWQLEAFRDFQCQHSEAMLYLHTMRRAGDGLDLEALVQALGIPPQTVIFPDPYQYHNGLPETYLADVYRSADVLLAAGMSEGFGIPIAEAQACGTPVVTTNFSAMPELTINGLTTEPDTRFYNPLFQAWQAVPSVANVTAALESIYGWSEQERLANAYRGVVHMRNTYDWDIVVRDYWAPLLAQIEAEREPRRRAAYLAKYEAFAERDHQMPRGEADHWYNAHRFEVATALLQTLDLDHTPRLVDLGAADGALGQALTDAEIPAVYTPVELVSSRVERALAQDNRWPWQVGDATEWGDDECTDIVACLELLEHVPDPQALLANAHRILTDSGYLLVSTPNDPEARNVDGVEHLRGYGAETLEQAVTAAGFAVVARASTVPGLYGPEGLLMHPERLGYYQLRAEMPAWDYADGSNLYLLCKRVERVAAEPADDQPSPEVVEVGA